MWECNYGKEPLDIRLLVLRFLRRSPVILIAALLGAFCVGGPYFLVKVTFGPAKEYEAVTDFYIDYAVQENGEEYTYFNQTTWTQLITDDVFTDKILTYMSELKDGGTEDVEKLQEAAGVTKRQLREYLYATMLSDTRIVTTTVTTNDPELTMRIEKALTRAMEDFGGEQKEIAGVRILQEPAEASLVAADVRTFRACMLGCVVFAAAAVFYLLIYFVLDEGIYIPASFERRYGIPMLGTIRSPELPALAGKLVSGETVVLAIDREVDPEQVGKALAERDVKTAGVLRVEEIPMAEKAGSALLAVKAGAHNGKRIEKALELCRKCGLSVSAALLWEADEKLIRAYEMPEHVLHAWGRMRKNAGKKEMERN